MEGDDESRKQKAESRKQKNVMTCYVCVKGTVFEKEAKVASTILARDCKGFGNQRGNAVIVLRN